MDISSAVAAAVEFATQAYGDGHVRDPLLEEIEMSSDERRWLVTISWIDPDRQTELTKVLSPWAAANRVYKVFHVERGSGNVSAMKIRETSGG